MINGYKPPPWDGGYGARDYSAQQRAALDSVNLLKHELRKQEKIIQGLRSELAHLRGALDKHRKVYKWMTDNGYDDVLTAAEVALALEK